MFLEKKLVKNRFKKSIKTYDQNAVLQKEISDNLISLIKEKINISTLDNIFEIGAGSGFLTKELIKLISKKTNYSINDLIEDYSVIYDDFSHLLNKYMGDAEIIKYPENLDLIVSSNSLQWIQNKKDTLKKISTSINKEGYFAFSSFSIENLKEVKEISGKGLNYLKYTEIIEMLNNNFDIIHSEEKIIEILFDNPMQVLFHLKSTGVNSISQTHWSKSDLNRFCDNYKEKFSTKEGKVKLTYNPVWFIAKKK